MLAFFSSCTTKLEFIFFSQLTDSYRRESVRCPTFCAGWSTTKTTMPFAAGGLGNTCCAGSGLGGHVFEHFPKNCLELLIVIKLPSRFTKDMKPSHIRSMTCSKLGIYIYMYIVLLAKLGMSSPDRQTPPRRRKWPPNSWRIGWNCGHLRLSPLRRRRLQMAELLEFFLALIGFSRD